MHADGAIAGIVDDQNHRIQPGLKRGAHLVAIHLEVTVTGETQNKSRRVMYLGCQRRRQPEPHRPALWPQHALAFSIRDELVRPDREIARPMGDDRILGQRVPDMRGNQTHINVTRLRRRRQGSEIVLTRGVAPCGPGLIVGKRNAGKRVRHGVGAGMDGQVRRVDLADLTIRSVAMNQLCRHFRRVKQAVAVGRRLAKPDVDRDDQVGLAKQVLHIGVHRDTGVANK